LWKSNNSTRSSPEPAAKPFFMSKRIITLDIGASTIKLAEFQLSRDHQLTLVTYGTRAIGLDPQDEANRMVYTGTAVDELFRELRIKLLLWRNGYWTQSTLSICGGSMTLTGIS